MSQFFNPIAALQILKNLEMAPCNSGAEDVSCQNIPDRREEYLAFLLDSELIAVDDDAHSITPKGRVLLRQAELLLLSADVSMVQ